ncbi:MAG: type II toxin-antitoxin system RelE/ParE family toxin [Parachlamydiaceae bacterium]|nr:type II toxin-antitoxin system RelE/ParE family toxin [Parachlamydiaceae bacterium]
MDKEIQSIIGKDICTGQEGWPLGMPLTRSIGNGLWEVRSSIPNGIARVIFTVKNNEIVLLHGFIKKTQKLPLKELEIAKNRYKSLE